ncbi:class I SAM-dependent methyltransferase [Rhizobiales bacterium]|uniref:class I SAM-dependent methyltransferase n=1 Tax=Hongsoonwoonella zoysiae TaxID=2821844 RepID=UPI001561015B|nr:class I SAM-dependent methyltransferase [Hongsoonwoonella zoysiae]NRG16980.1 class I SAM-dependent methyltransferase [Hongsoonwoonella zoysiae]
MSLALDQFEPKETVAAEAFADRIGEILNHGALAVMISIGHKTRLFDTLAGLPASTSTEIADAASLNERYVREWLAAMVTGGVVSYEPASKTYRLPASRAASITRSGELGNLAVYAQTIALLGQVEERIIDCFATGEGTSYSDYPCFHDFMAEDSGQTVVAQIDGLLDTLAPDLKSRLANGIDVLDAGCGRGLALIELARRYPESRFVGYDLCGDAIAFAKTEARSKGLENIHFEKRDLSSYDEKERYDFIASFDAVHDQKDPAALVRSLHDALKPGGIYLMQDIAGSARLENNLDFPMAAFLYTVSCCHCMPVSLGQGGEGLGTMWGWETAKRTLEEAGFASIEKHVFDHDPLNVWFVSRKN